MNLTSILRGVFWASKLDVFITRPITKCLLSWVLTKSDPWELLIIKILSGWDINVDEISTGLLLTNCVSSLSKKRTFEPEKRSDPSSSNTRK